MNPVQSKVEGTLPASWYSTKEIYDLERRAIFSRRWLLVTHELRFKKLGSYVRYTIAGFPFFIIKDREGNLNAFMNVCRHRAFPVVLQDEGTANILACKYHGWSYNLKGYLAKAPKFDTVSGFDKDQYSLFRVHLKRDKKGFLWVNFDTAEEPEVPWDNDFDRVDEQPRLNVFSMENYSFDHAWSTPGPYNWKTIIDNYNECYHCSVAHPGIAKTTNLNNYNVDTVKSYIEHYAEAKGLVDDAAGNVAPTYLFPNASITLTDNYFYLMRVVPVSEKEVSMEYEVYRHNDASDQDFQEIDAFFKQVESEDKYLCTNAQKNLNAGTYVTGPLQPANEKGVLHFKSLVKNSLYEHRRKEQQAGKQISPAQRSPATSDTTEEQLFCADLCSGPAKEIVW